MNIVNTFEGTRRIPQFFALSEVETMMVGTIDIWSREQLETVILWFNTRGGGVEPLNPPPGTPLIIT